MDSAHRLIVMRHGKAGELPGGPDAERALQARGRDDASAAGAWLRGRDLAPDAVICSRARRARQTWQWVSAALCPAAGPDADAESGARAGLVAVDDRLYGADAAEVAGIIGETGAGVRTLLYVGHNPAAVELASELTGTRLRFPPAAVAVIELTGPWTGLAAGTGRLAATWLPPGN